MTKFQYGVLMGFAGAVAAAVWQWQRTVGDAHTWSADDRGEVIFSNTPRPAES